MLWRAQFCSAPTQPMAHSPSRRRHRSITTDPLALEPVRPHRGRRLFPEPVLMDQRPDIGRDRIDVGVGEVAVATGRDLDIVAQRLLDHLQAVAPDQGSDGEVIAVAGAFGIPAMALVALPVRRLAMKDAIAEFDLLTRGID